MFADYHVHSAFSDDSDYDMEQVVIDAIDRGLDEICFTDHVDYGVKLDHGVEGYVPNLDEYGNIPRNVDYPLYFKTIAELQEKYGDKITIRKGLEYGVQTCHLQEFEDLYERYPLDFIIHSNHQVDDVEIYRPEYYENKSQKEYNREYYEEILRTAKAFKHYSVLGHIDSIIRYDPAGECPFEVCSDLIYEILKTVISDDKGIELNTSNVRYGLKDLTPSRKILKMYHDLGGKIITIGSDSHHPDHLGFHIEYGKEELKKLGFRYYCTYDKMVPIFHEL